MSYISKHRRLSLENVSFENELSLRAIFRLLSRPCDLLETRYSSNVVPSLVLRARHVERCIFLVL